MVVDNKLKAEDELLLSCARSKLEKEDEDRIISLLDNNLDWDYLLNKATRNRLRPLLYLNLNQVGSERVPEDVLQGLKSFFKSNARRNLLLTGELVKVMALLEDNGIKAVTYKGPVLAKGAYGNLAYREFGDVDVFIDKEEVLKAKKVMLDNGYQLYSSDLDSSVYKKFDWEYQFKSKQGVIIEINSKFEGPLFSFKTDSRLLFDNFTTRPINNFKVQIPSPENEFLMLCIHCGKHNWSRLSWICDLNEFLQSRELNWKEVWEKANRLGVARILIINLILVRDLFGINYPDILKLVPDTDANSLALKIEKRLLKDDKISWNLLEKLFLDLKKRDDIFLGMKDCMCGLYKPSIEDYGTVKLPGFFSALYIILRPLFLLKKYGKGPI